MNKKEIRLHMVADKEYESVNPETSIPYGDIAFRVGWMLGCGCCPYDEEKEETSGEF